MPLGEFDVKATAKVVTFSFLLQKKPWMVKPPTTSFWIGEVFVCPGCPEALWTLNLKHAQLQWIVWNTPEHWPKDVSMLTTLYTLQSPWWMGDQQNSFSGWCKSPVRFNSCRSFPAFRWQANQDWGDDCERKDAGVPNTFAMGFKWSTVCWWHDQTLSTSVPHWPPSNPHVQIGKQMKISLPQRRKLNSNEKQMPASLPSQKLLAR